MKKLIYRIFFFISLLPYAAIFSYAVYSAINGITYTFIQSQIIYGFDGFLYALIVGAGWLIYYPILPICLTYQIAYFAVRKHDNKKPIWISTIVVAVISVLLIFGLKATIDFNQQRRDLEYSNKEEAVKNSVNEMVKNADEIIGYEKNTIYGDGIAKTQFKHNTLFIDYDSKIVAFLTNKPEYWEFELSENITLKNYNVQYKKELNDPGETLIAFYLNEEEKHKTIALQLFMEDGSVYAIDNIKDKVNRDGLYLGLQSAQLENEAERKYNSIIGEWEANVEGAIMKIVFYNRDQYYTEENGVRTEGHYTLNIDGFATYPNGIRSNIEINGNTMTLSAITDRDNNLIKFKKK
ncbi:MAG: hypothetical protein PHI32_06675 [Dysgonamonadaceae bacterium]|nr:hypothetical protein [Dysgonamonadaceae bacterium]